MTKFARIVNDIAIDVCDNPSELFHPLVAAEFTEVPEQVETGFKLNNGNWIPPITETFSAEEVAVTNKIQAIDFKLLFSAQERISVTQAKATDALIDDFFSLVDDPRMTTIDLALQSTKDIINHLVTVNILTPQRAEDILANKPV